MKRPALHRVFRVPFSRRGLLADVEDEVRFHIEGRIEELVALGMSRDAATDEARRRFGDVDAHRRVMRAIDEEMLRMRKRTDLGDSLGREVKHAIRALSRAPTFTVMTVLTLALGLGAATAIFTILDAVVLRPLPYPHGDRLVALSSPVPGIKASPVWGLARHEMFYFKQQSHVLEDLGVYRTELGTITGDGGAHQAERVAVADVSASLFGVLGIVPERGRLLNPDDNVRALDTLDVALMSHGLWERRYGDTAIVGKQIDLEGYPVTVVGVLPRVTARTCGSKRLSLEATAAGCALARVAAPGAPAIHTTAWEAGASRPPAATSWANASFTVTAGIRCRASHSSRSRCGRSQSTAA